MPFGWKFVAMVARGRVLTDTEIWKFVAMVARGRVLMLRAAQFLWLLVARGRVQLPTFALGVRCSMQLSYRATGG